MAHNWFLGEIMLVAFDFAPKYWAECNGQLLPRNQNLALFQLLQTRYGGDGINTFALPDLRDRVPVHVGNGLSLGMNGGEVSHALTENELPQHVHLLNGVSEVADSPSPNGNRFAAAPSSVGDVYGGSGAVTAMSGSALSNVGGSQPHTNMQPYLTLTYVIALQGTFPPHQ